MTSNKAAYLPSAKALIEVKDAPSYTPGPHDVLIKNTSLAFNPVEWKMQKLGIFPIPYPAILGMSYAGTVENVGSAVVNVKRGDKVAVLKRLMNPNLEYGAFQRLPLAQDDTIAKLDDHANLDAAAAVVVNLATVVGALHVVMGLARPATDGSKAPANGQRLLVYGGSSRVGMLAVHFASQAGYTVITTSSPANRAAVAPLGAAKIINHTQEAGVLIAELKASGPYDHVFDTIGTAETSRLLSSVLSAQGGGTFYATQPLFGPPELPPNVDRKAESYPEVMDKDEEVAKWFFEWVPRGLKNGQIVPPKVEKVEGGLEGVQGALDRMMKGVSGVKLVGSPWD